MLQFASEPSMIFIEEADGNNPAITKEADGVYSAITKETVDEYPAIIKEADGDYPAIIREAIGDYPAITKETAGDYPPIAKEAKGNYTLFIEELTGIVKCRMGDQYSVRIYKVTKNNSLELDSMVLLKEGKNYAPNIYLQPYYEAYLQGTSLEELAERLCSIYHQCTLPIVKEDFNYSFNDMKAYVIYRLVSYERNRKLLSKIPHMKYLDLAITFHCLVRDDEDGIGTIRITNDHMELWQTNLEELYNLATINTMRLFPASIRSMEEVIRGMFASEMTDGIDDVVPDEVINQFFDNSQISSQNKMYILTNQKGINGASCLLYENVLCSFANQIDSDFFILPSSIHEIILVPRTKSMTMEALADMVKDVNRSQVAEDEVLSDRVYYYSRANNAISM